MAFVLFAPPNGLLFQYLTNLRFSTVEKMAVKYNGEFTKLSNMIDELKLNSEEIKYIRGQIVFFDSPVKTVALITLKEAKKAGRYYRITNDGVSNKHDFTEFNDDFYTSAVSLKGKTRIDCEF